MSSVLQRRDTAGSSPVLNNIHRLYIYYIKVVRTTEEGDCRIKSSSKQYT